MANTEKGEGQQVLVIGGGVSGLAAALELAQAGWRVTVLEARNRLGGRIFTTRSGEMPVELGAEFIHGKNELLWRMVREAGLKTLDVPDRNQLFSDGTLQPVELWEEVGRVMQRIDARAPDQSFRAFLDGQSIPEALRGMALGFVEGFDGADPNTIGVHALHSSEFNQEGSDASQFRVAQGYSALTDFMARRLAAVGVGIQRNTVVRSVRWRPGHVEIQGTCEGKAVTHAARAAIVTLPLGVLKSGEVRFDPVLPDKMQAIERMAFGTVRKVVLRFRRCFWPEPDFGFIHAFGEAIPTWWSDERGPVLTGWAGGPKAEGLSSRTNEELVEEALGILGRIFRVSVGSIRGELVEACSHDWLNDPFTRGAYSYIPVNGLDLPKMLAVPVAGTLFFAGEATVSDLEPGTVHAALASGARAAGELHSSAGRLGSRAAPERT